MTSCIALAINALIYHYPGNNYFPPHTLFVAFALCLIYGGFYLFFDAHHKMTQISREIILLFFVMSLIVIATNAAQYTPFLTIDKHIMAFEAYFPFHLKSIVAWSDSHAFIKRMMETIYVSLTYQMTYLPLCVIFFGRKERIREYYFLLLITAWLGYSFYYFFPTTAPASVIDSEHFSELQKATGLKFNQLHHYIQPTTFEGGLIALPSFHVIWAWLCVYLVRDWPLLCKTLFAINLLLALSCVALGWHYPIDLIGSVCVILCGHFIHAQCKKYYARDDGTDLRSMSFNIAARRHPASANRASTT
jgi:hypothetical protein